jgi:RNA polymerase sigma-70 factor, ECF subfamily
MGPTAGQLFERHHLIVFRFFRRMTGSTTTAEDLTQDVFVRVVRGIETYEDQARERSWIFRIARNVLLDRQRQLERRPTVVPLDTAAVVPIRPPQELGAALEAALGQLPEAERQAFLLRELVGLGYQEIAAVTDATPAAVRMQIYRARLALRGALGPPGWARAAKEIPR